MKKLMAITVISVLALFIGTAFAYGNGFFGSKNHEDFFGRFNMTQHHMGMMEKLNLSGNATMLDIRNSMMEKRTSDRYSLLEDAKQKLGLPSNATNEEIRTALSSWTEQNKDLLMMSGHGGCMGPRGNFGPR